MWEPSFPLTAAEAFVDYPGHLQAIVGGRARVERAGQKVTARAAVHIAEHGSPQAGIRADLADAIGRSLNMVAGFGYRSAQTEIRAQRAGQPRAEYTVPDAGRFGRAARQGKRGVRDVIRERAAAAADAIISAAVAAYTVELAIDDRDQLRVQIVKAADRVLHNHVIELVGETLNLGRAAGALTMPTPPTFALRSEQLDKRMCDPCGRFHGTIVAVDSDDFYSLMPPSGCLGGGRCRGIYVFGDEPESVEQREAA